jgi:AraC-like DNA-binding protein
VDICRESLPRAELRGHVECIWNTAPIEDPRFEIIPDGCVDVCFVLSPHNPRTLLFGTTTRTTAYDLEPGVPYLGVRFRPGQASLFAAGQVPDLTNTSVEIAQFLGITCEAILDAKNFATQRSLIETAILSALSRDACRKPQAINRALALIHSVHGNIRIRDLAAACDLSRRQLERQFLDHVGVSPKLYARIRRFRSVLAHFEDPPDPESPNTAAIAAAYGYADQSHLIRDFGDFSYSLPRSA